MDDDKEEILIWGSHVWSFFNFLCWTQMPVSEPRSGHTSYGSSRVFCSSPSLLEEGALWHTWSSLNHKLHLGYPLLGWHWFVYHGRFGCSPSYTKSPHVVADVELELVLPTVEVEVEEGEQVLQMHLGMQMWMLWLTQIMVGCGGHYLLLHMQVKCHWQDQWFPEIKLEFGSGFGGFFSQNFGLHSFMLGFTVDSNMLRN